MKSGIPLEEHTLETDILTPAEDEEKPDILPENDNEISEEHQTDIPADDGQQEDT